MFLCLQAEVEVLWLPQVEGGIRKIVLIFLHLGRALFLTRSRISRFAVDGRHVYISRRMGPLELPLRCARRGTAAQQVHFHQKNVAFTGILVF